MPSASRPDPARPPRLSAALFDLDGVLVDSYECWRLLLNDALEHHGKPAISAERFHAAWGQSLEDDCAAFLPELSPAALARFYADGFPRRAREVRLLPHAPEALALARARGLKTACVTNAPRAVALAVLAATGLGDGFDTVVAGGDAARPKPAPDPLVEALARLGAAPHQAVMVGDTRYDVDAARAAHVLAIVVGGATIGDLGIAGLADFGAALDEAARRGRLEGRSEGGGAPL